MPPIPLPVPTPGLPFSNIANVVPPPPQDPPSVDDVLLAKAYAQRVVLQTTVGALVYADSILAAASGGGVSFISPPLTFLNTTINQFFAKIDQLIISTAKNHNRTLGDGRPVAFVPVPFPDGTMPSGNNDTPTALTDAAVIDNLSANELRAYCHAYYPNRGYDNGQQQPDRRVVREAIGCSAV
ncbi:hypothetical protein B0H14DRAFT_2859448 [Mycena olivaceomarginata]|nr:hypothetical protein B0H14DRAFT_2859448 [Mycena olivaceomarginata]